ncbi:MAG: membrane protein insertase YidC [Actinobacteria bacterium]|nr:membrane protein insertase YidC [Actinomycetota bacterium]MBV9254341.1 membrane protein insertase YidC [Actinomycetota bacterium]
MFNVLAGLVAFFYSVVPSYGIAITLLTLAVMGVLAPFTWKGTRSMLAMQRLQPELKKLQAKHKGDRQALNEAMMAFYKEHQINPLSGCLPLLVQMPVLLVMYRVIGGLAHTSKVHGVTTPTPKYIKHSSDLYKALIHDHGKMDFLGIDLAKAARAVHGSIGHLAPLYLLIALVIVTGFIQARQMSGRNPGAAQANPQAQMMQKIFPLFTGFISIEIAAGVVLYFLVSNVFRIVQTDLMYRLDPKLSTEVKAEVAEIEAKAEEIVRKEKGASPPPTGRVTPSAKSPTNGARTNGAKSSGARRRSAKRRRGR